MPKINVRDKVTDNELDLSMCDIQDVPVKDIVPLKRVTNVDLSNNKIVVLPESFAISLVRIIKLDLSQNQLQTLPDNFGYLKNLRELDLYSNKLQHLPLSLGECKFLRWLDLKNNPLVPAISEVAGPCLDTKQCQTCAKKIVAFLNNMQLQLNKEVERRSAQRKRDLELKEQQQSQIKKKNQKNAKKAAKAEKKMIRNSQSDHSEESEKSSLVSHNGRLTVTETKRMPFVFRIFWLMLLITSTSTLLGLWLYNYDQPKYRVLSNYIIKAWNPVKSILLQNKQFTVKNITTSEVFKNIQDLTNSSAIKLYELYTAYLNEEYVKTIGNSIYDAIIYYIKLIADFISNILKELPKVFEVIQKRLLG